MDVGVQKWPVAPVSTIKLEVEESRLELDKFSFSLFVIDCPRHSVLVGLLNWLPPMLFVIVASFLWPCFGLLHVWLEWFSLAV